MINPLAVAVLLCGVLPLAGQEPGVTELRAQVLELRLELTNLQLQFHEARIATLQTELDRVAGLARQIDAEEATGRSDLEGVHQRLGDASVEPPERAELEKMRSQFVEEEGRRLERRLILVKRREAELRDQLTRELANVQTLRLRLRVLSAGN